MITIRQGNFHFFSTLFRINGSALYRAIFPSIFSTGILGVVHFTSDDPSSDFEERWFHHPYPIACMMVAFTFLLTFKLNFSYNRYWEACTAIHQMHSKWLDVGMELAAFHLQSEKFAHLRPPAFGEHPHIDHVIRERERLRPMTPRKLQEILRIEEEEEGEGTEDVTSSSQQNGSAKRRFSDNTNSRRGGVFRSIFRRRRTNRKKKIIMRSFMDSHYESSINHSSFNSESQRKSINSSSNHRESNSLAAGLYSSNPAQDSNRSSKQSGISKLSSIPDLSGGMSKKASPSLFLQEATHLLSLLSAVAFATLRNDIETAESPLESYTPGSNWPPVDPDSEHATAYNDFYQSSGFMNACRSLLGFVRTPAQRTVYNACRPFPVLGGASDAEIDVLQRARGPLAKTALCTMWLQEFISREYLSGSLGNVAPPILSRMYQYTSDGMLGYNQARKVAYVPFPFPHSQLTTFFLLVVACFLPILMLTFVNNITVAALLNAMTVGVFFGEFLVCVMTCISAKILFTLKFLFSISSVITLGLWLVANELEDPFRNAPNDLPLNNFQAQFNEALVCVFAGFHPEAWWDVNENKKSLESNGDSKDSAIDKMLVGVKEER